MSEVGHSDYTIRSAAPTDRSAFLDLHHTVFGTWPASVAEGIFEWKYVDNPYIDDLPVIVVTKDGEVVGARGYTAFELAVGDKVVLGLQSGDLMVHPDHRRRGLFTEMNELGLDRYGGDGVLVFSVPASEPREGYLATGWERVRNPKFLQFGSVRGDPAGWPSDIGTLVERAHAETYRRYRSGLMALQSPSVEYTVERTETLPVARLLELYERRRPEGIHVRRTDAFYRWRFASPLSETTTYLARRGETVAAAAVVDENDHRVLVRELLPVSGENRALFSLLVRLGAEFSDREVAVWPLRIHRPVLYRAGFLPKAITPRARNASDLVVKATGATDQRPEQKPWELQLTARDY